MAPKGGGGGGRGGGGRGGSRGRGHGGESVVVGSTSGASLSQETSSLMLYMVLLPILMYYLEDGKLTEVVRWAVGKLANGGKESRIEGVESKGEGVAEEDVPKRLDEMKS